MEKDKISVLLELVNLKDIEEFKTMTALQKSRTILKDFASYHRFREKYSSSYTEQEKERFVFEQERYFMKANKQLKLLTEKELLVLIDLLENKIITTMTSGSEKNKLNQKLMFSSVIRSLNNLDIQNVEFRLKLENIFKLMDEFSEQLVR